MGGRVAVELRVAGQSCQELYKGSLVSCARAELNQATIDELVSEKPHAVQLKSLDCEAVDASVSNVRRRARVQSPRGRRRCNSGRQCGLDGTARSSGGQSESAWSCCLRSGLN